MGARRVARMVAVAGLAAGFLSIGAGLAGPASAALPAHPAPCTWSFGPLSTQGAAGTQILGVTLVPSSPTMSCIQTVTMTVRITNSTGGVPAGITSDGGTALVTLLFSRGEYPAPTVTVAWGAYCTDAPQAVFLHLSGAGMAAVYPLGQSRPCSEGPGPNSAVYPPKVFSPNPAAGLTPSAGGYRIATVNGVVLRQPGSIEEAGNVSSAPVVGIAPAPGGGFWLATSTGGVYAFNGAPFYGSAGNLQLAAPIVGMAATPSGHGYWLVASDGGIFSYGDAAFHGSTGNLRLNAPVVGMAPSRDGGGYWLVASDGGVFTFGDAAFHGSAGSIPLVAPVVGMAADTATGGYWLGASDGGVFSYDAPFHGSAGNLHLAAPMSGITATPDSGGYWLLGADGGVFTYGDAPFHGTGGQVVFP